MINRMTISGLISICLLIGTALCGCKDAKKEVDEIGTNVVIRSQDRALMLKLRSDMQTIHRSIELFYASNGRYPESLDELKQKGVISKIPKEPFGGEWNYDPQTGSIISSSHPEYTDPDAWDGSL